MPDKPKGKPKGKAQGKPFTKNDSRINRKGRPKKGQALTEILHDALDEVKSNGKTRREVITEKIITLAEKGDIIALKYIFDRIDGKPVETIKANIKQKIIDTAAIHKKLEDALLDDH